MIHHHYCPITRQTEKPEIVQSEDNGYYFIYGIYFPEYQGKFNAVVDATNNKLISAQQHGHTGAFNRAIYQDTYCICWGKIQETVQELISLTKQ